MQKGACTPAQIPMGTSHQLGIVSVGRRDQQHGRKGACGSVCRIVVTPLPPRGAVSSHQFLLRPMLCKERGSAGPQDGPGIPAEASSF